MATQFSSNYFERSVSYTAAMVEMFKTIPQNVGKPMTSGEKNQKLITDIEGGWYLEKCKKGLPPLKRTKLGKKAHRVPFYILTNIIHPQYL